MEQDSSFEEIKERIGKLPSWTHKILESIVMLSMWQHSQGMLSVLYL